MWWLAPLWNTQVLIQPDRCVPVVAALVRVYLDYVSQAPRFSFQDASRTPKKPRMKHLLRDWGIERYLQQVNQQLSYPLYSVTDCPTPSSTEPYAHLGVHHQQQTGLSYIGIHLRLGQLTPSQLYRLVQLSETFGSQQSNNCWSYTNNIEKPLMNRLENLQIDFQLPILNNWWLPQNFRTWWY